jgi:hypothetical protein
MFELFHSEVLRLHEKVLHDAFECCICACIRKCYHVRRQQKAKADIEYDDLAMFNMMTTLDSMLDSLEKQNFLLVKTVQHNGDLVEKQDQELTKMLDLIRSVNAACSRVEAAHDPELKSKILRDVIKSTSYFLRPDVS